MVFFWKNDPERSFEELLINWMCDSEAMVEVRGAKDKVGVGLGGGIAHIGYLLSSVTG